MREKSGSMLLPPLCKNSMEDLIKSLKESNEMMRETRKNLEKYRDHLKERIIKDPNNLPQDKKDEITIEMALTDISNSIARLKKMGVDRRIVNDTIINSMEYGELNYLASDIDSFLRGRIWN